MKDMMVGTSANNVRSVSCALSIGFIKGGEFNVIFGDGTPMRGTRFILKGMEWPEEEILVRLGIPEQAEPK